MPKNFIINLYLALWRVLVIDKCGSLTLAAAKHTPPQKNKAKLSRMSLAHHLQRREITLHIFLILMGIPQKFLSAC